MTTLGLALLAGLLSTLSPCVLPLVPVVLGAAAAQHRAGPVALALGIAISFTAIGLFVATLGFSLGLDAALFRKLAAVMLLVFGAALVFERLGTGLALALEPLARAVSGRRQAGDESGLAGQFALGLLLGTAWSPCVGPTLGAASVLAAEGKDLGQVALTMALFGIGAALPLLLLGLLSREARVASRGRLIAAGSRGKVALGIVLISVALLILSGLDKGIEAWLVDAMPAWLTALTTRY